MRNRPYGTHAGRPSFEEACRMYVHRFTAEHVPLWAGRGLDNGRFYAPQFSSDREWYEHTLFPGEDGHLATGPGDSCHTSGQTWPYGQWLAEPYRQNDRPLPAPPPPRVGLTFSAGSSDEGVEVTGLDEAARRAADWIRGIDPAEAGTDFYVSIEILDND